MKTLQECDLCGNKDFSLIFEGFDRRHSTKGDYTEYRCNSCGLIFLNPQPIARELRSHYPPNYYSLEEPKHSSAESLIYSIYYSKRKNLLLKLFFSPLKQIMIRTVPIVPHGKLLDVGCGAGDFLAQIKSLSMECYGVEPGDFNKKFSKKHKLNIFQGTLDQANFPDNHFDVITLNHVFEHLSEPTKTLHELHRILKPEGTLVVAVPQSKCLAYWLFRKYWTQLDVPRHLFIHSTTTLKEYAKKTGFSVSKIRFNSGPGQFWASFLYWKTNLRKRSVCPDDKTRMNRITFLLFLAPSLLCNLLRIGDQVEIILTKPRATLQTKNL